jgi:hypothetical protein
MAVVASGGALSAVTSAAAAAAAAAAGGTSSGRQMEPVKRQRSEELLMGTSHLSLDAKAPQSLSIQPGARQLRQQSSAELAQAGPGPHSLGAGTRISGKNAKGGSIQGQSTSAITGGQVPAPPQRNQNSAHPQRHPVSSASNSGTSNEPAHHHHHVHILHHHHGGEEAVLDSSPTSPNDASGKSVSFGSSASTSESKLRKRGRPPKPVVAETIIARREMHSAYQRRRRDSIAEGFRALAMRVPLVTVCSSREVILKAASEYIDALRAGNPAVADQIAAHQSSASRSADQEMADEGEMADQSGEHDDGSGASDMPGLSRGSSMAAEAMPANLSVSGFEGHPEAAGGAGDFLDGTKLARRLAFAVDIIGTLRTRMRVLEAELAQSRVELAHARAEVVEARLGQLQGRF